MALSVRRLTAGAFACYAALCLGQAARAQLPVTQLFAVSPPGGRQGTAVDLTITSGADLDGVKALYFSHPGITASPKMSPAPLAELPATELPRLFCPKLLCRAYWLAFRP